MKPCPFCDIAEPVMLRNQHALAIADKHPISPGHSLIVPSVHVENIFGLSSDQYWSCFDLLRALRENLAAQYSPAGFNVVINNGQAAGQTIAHAHIHLVPRYLNDSAQPTPFLDQKK